MNNKIKNIIIIILILGFLFGFCGWFLLKENQNYSNAERRALKALPAFDISLVLSGEYMTNFEDAAPDQFPLRDTFRTIKANSVLNIFRQKDNNKIYYKNGYLSKAEYPINYSMLDHAADRFYNIYKTYLENKNVNIYFSVVPDKNMFLAPAAGNLSINYNEFIDYMRQKTQYMQYIDITGLLEISDYYKTDTHWRQEKLLDVAAYLAENMGTSLTHGYEENTLEEPFYGVYYGQSGLNVETDKLVFLTSEVLNESSVLSYSTGKAQKIPVYNMEKAVGKDPYEMFLSGSEPLLVIENPNAKTDKELVLFRDSFGSSIAPLLVSGYSKMTVIDIRYMEPGLISNFVKFNNQDVLFLYSTVLLNSSLGIR